MSLPMTAGIGSRWSLRFLPALNIQWFCRVCLWLLKEEKLYIHETAKECSDHSCNISIESRLKMSSRESWKCASFLLMLKKSQPQRHRICSNSITEKAWTKSNTSYKQLHSSEGQLWNLKKTVPISHSTSDHTRRAILKKCGLFTVVSWNLLENLLSRNKIVRFKTSRALKVMLPFFAGPYPRNQEERKEDHMRNQIIFTRRLERASDE